MDGQVTTQRRSVHAGRFRRYVRPADPIAQALVNVEGDDKTLFLRIVLGDRRRNTDIGISVREIEAPQRIAIGLEAAGIVEIIIEQEAEQIGLTGLDRSAELRRR